MKNVCLVEAYYTYSINLNFVIYITGGKNANLVTSNVTGFIRSKTSHS